MWALPLDVKVVMTRGVGSSSPSGANSAITT